MRSPLPLVLLSSSLLAHFGHAATETWTTGAGTANWSQSTNWLGTNKPPISGDALVFDTTTGATSLNNDLTSSAFNIASLTFTAAAPSYTLTGNAFTLTGVITVNSTAAQTVANNITLSNGVHTVAPATGGGDVTLSGNIDGAGSLSLGGVGTLTLTGNNTFTGGVAIGGSGGASSRVLHIGSATALGSGTLAITNQPTFDNSSGSALVAGNATTISNGSIAAFVGSNDLTLGALSLVGSAASRTLNVNGSSLIFNGGLTEATAGSVLSKGGAGKLVLNGASTITGQVTVTAGTLQLGNTAALGAAGNTIQLGANSTTVGLDLATDSSVNAYNVSIGNLNPGTVQFISDRATSGGGITQSLGNLTIGVGPVGPTLSFLSGANATSGQASVAFASTILGGSAGGVVTFVPTTADVALGSLTSANTGANPTTTAKLDGTGRGSILGGVTDGAGGKIIAITKSNTSTWTLAGLSTYTGSTTISGGALQANDNAGLSGSSYLKLDGGVLQSNGSASFTRTLSATAAGTNFQWTTNGGGFSASGGKLTVTINNSAASELTWGTVAGTNIVGTLKFGSSSAGAETELTNKINLAGSDRTVDVTSGTGGDFATLSGVIRNSTGTAGLVKTGSGLLVLSANNTYNGTTAVNAGTLIINGSNTASAVSVASGASLGGNGSAGAVTVSAGGILTPGSGVGNLTASSFSLAAGSFSNFDIHSATAGDFDSVTSAGTISLGGSLSFNFSGTTLADGSSIDLFLGTLSGSYDSVLATGAYSGSFTSMGGSIFQLNSNGSTLSFDNSTGILSIAAVPEPAATALVGVGLVVMLARLRRRTA